MTLTAEHPIKTQETVSPPLKWAGGKRWLIPVLQGYWQSFSQRRLVEPFCGGLAVALGLKPQHTLLNDVNAHLINFYRQLQAGLVTQETFKNESAFYYQVRENFNQLILTHQANSAEAAVWFYYLNRTGYNGLCRFNRKGLFNVPFGDYKTIHYTQDFSAYKVILQDWCFTHQDFETLETTAQDFIYVDPPYDVPFVSYAQHGFTWPDQERLVQWLSKQPCPVIASNQATPRILELYEKAGFTIRLLNAPRRISCTGDRTPAQEMLAIRGL